MKRINRKKLKYGSSALALTVLVIAAVVIFNVIVAALAGRYDWMYVDMTRSPVYDISDECREYIEDHVISEMADGEKITVIFCDDRENIESDPNQVHIHDSIYDVAEMFEGRIDIEYLDIWENPSRAASYGVSATTDVVCVYGDRYETMSLTDFYIFSATDSTYPVAYNGEKIIASCFMRVTQKETPMCYFTANHGETMGDYEFMRNIVEAGYTISYIDISNADIPADCDLLVTFDPKQDLIVSDGVSELSERDKLDAYMANGGKYMVFLSADTFVSGEREHFEGFLSDWGVKYMHNAGADGVEECYLIKDSANSLSVDGYQVLAEYSDSDKGSKAVLGLSYPNVFKNTTCISVADGYNADGKGGFAGEQSGRLMYPLLVSGRSAEAWAGGRAVARATDEPFILMSMSEEKCENGKTAYLIASASTEFAGEDAMQSAVLGNSRTLTQLLCYMGKDNAPAELTFKTFSGTEIQSLTTSTANTVTAVLAVIPALALTIVGIVVLVRRRNA